MIYFGLGKTKAINEVIIYAHIKSIWIQETIYSSLVKNMASFWRNYNKANNGSYYIHTYNKHLNSRRQSPLL